MTLQVFLASPEVGGRCELIDGEVVPKVAPKRFHSKTQRALLRHLETWGDTRGDVGVEWAVQLTRQGKERLRCLPPPLYPSPTETIAPSPTIISLG